MTTRRIGGRTTLVQLLGDRQRLTVREVEIVRLVALGLRNGEAARQLSISQHTVKTHLTNILRKLHMRSRMDLALHALRTGLVRLDEWPPDRS